MPTIDRASSRSSTVSDSSLASLPIDGESPALLHVKSKMVCRHWKQGWCKFNDNCRFLHPWEKKGRGPSAKVTPPPAPHPSSIVRGGGSGQSRACLVTRRGNRPVTPKAGSVALPVGAVPVGVYPSS
jgi:hypothetical protein